MELGDAREVFDAGDKVVAEVDHVERFEAREIGDARDGVGLQEQAAQQLHVGDVFNLFDVVFFQPQGLNACVLVQVLDPVKAEALEVEIVVEARRHV